jgi:endo-1,3(4)-beta-glucanase
MKKNFFILLTIVVINLLFTINAKAGVVNSLAGTGCVGSSSVAQAGSFSVGYKYIFETIGTDVKITFELLDTDKSGISAILWKKTPFTEFLTPRMTNVSGNIYTQTITGQTIGATISYAVKFEYAGGLAVTQYINYVVGTDCAGTNDILPPTNFTATIGAITASSVEIVLNAVDVSGKVLYGVSYNAVTKSTTSDSGVQKSFLIGALTPETDYNFSVSAKDFVGNTALNSPILLSAKTGVDTNTECSGTSSVAQQGSFSAGYKYAFQTIGTDVKITFELLDTDKSGLVAFLWKQTPFTETSMTNVSGKIYTKTITGQTIGATISYAVKFAYAGGQSVTKYFSYVVGNTCPLGVETSPELKQTFYPNPVKNKFYMQLLDDKNKIMVTDMLGRKIVEDVVKSSHTLDMSSYKTGVYFLKVENTYGTQTVKIIKE